MYYAAQLWKYRVCLGQIRLASCRSTSRCPGLQENVQLQSAKYGKNLCEAQIWKEFLWFVWMFPDHVHARTPLSLSGKNSRPAAWEIHVRTAGLLLERIVCQCCLFFFWKEPCKAHSRTGLVLPCYGKKLMSWAAIGFGAAALRFIPDKNPLPELRHTTCLGGCQVCMDEKN